MQIVPSLSTFQPVTNQSGTTILLSYVLQDAVSNFFNEIMKLDHLAPLTIEP